MAKIKVCRICWDLAKARALETGKKPYECYLAVQKSLVIDMCYVYQEVEVPDADIEATRDNDKD